MPTAPTNFSRVVSTSQLRPPLQSGLCGPHHPPKHGLLRSPVASPSLSLTDMSLVGHSFLLNKHQCHLTFLLLFLLCLLCKITPLYPNFKCCSSSRLNLKASSLLHSAFVGDHIYLSGPASDLFDIRTCMSLRQ